VPEELDDAQLGVVTEDEWRAHWPTAEQLTDEPVLEEDGGDDADPPPQVDEREDQDSSVEPQ
jgi:XTP/dITP diphosphohydrolase